MYLYFLAHDVFCFILVVYDRGRYCDEVILFLVSHCATLIIDLYL